MGFFLFFSTGIYAGIGTKYVESENIMKSTHKKNTIEQWTVGCGWRQNQGGGDI